MRKFFYASVFYTFAGLAAGLLYRTLTHDRESWTFTQLNVSHTHLIALGTTMMLIFLVLERTFALSKGRFFSAFFWTYNAGLLLTTIMMLVNGILALNGAETTPPMRTGISGLGHIAVTVAFVFFFLNLNSRIKAVDRTEATDLTTVMP